MKASIKHLGEYSEQHSSLYRSPQKRRRRLSMAAGGALLGGVGAALLSPAIVATGIVGKALMVTRGVSTAFGGYKGYRLANSYLGDMRDFSFNPLTNSSAASSANHQFIFINGFLTQGNQTSESWLKALQLLTTSPEQADASPNTIFQNLTTAPCWLLNWESKKAAEWHHTVTGPGVHSLLIGQWRKAPVHVLSQLADNAWHQAQANAKKAGRLLADAIMQTPPHQQFTLVGHSLGARVVFYALQYLAESLAKYRQDDDSAYKIRHALLLGAAQGRRNRNRWLKVMQACEGKVINCYSTQDTVLRWAYQSVHAGMSRPAGLGPAPLPVINIDCSDIVGSHSGWKGVMPQIRLRVNEALSESITSAM